MIQYFSKQSSNASIQLKQLPKFKSPNKIVRISYPNNSIKRIPASLLSAHNIEYIDLSHNRLNKIQKIFHLQKLKHLNLSHNQLTQIHKDIVNLKQLEYANFSYNKIAKIQNIKPLQQLFKSKGGNIEVDLEGNELMMSYSMEVKNKFDTSVISVSQQANQINELKQLIQNSEKQREVENLSQNQTTKMIQNDDKLLNIHYCFQSSPKFQSYSSNQISIVGNIPNLKLQKEKQQIVAFQQKFMILSDNINLPNHQLLSHSFKEQAVGVINYIGLYRELLNFISYENIELQKLIKEYESHVIKVSEQERMIKDLHQQTIYIISQNKQISMQFYKVWVHLYRKLRQKTGSVNRNVKQIIQLNIRDKQIQYLVNISPQKNLNLQDSKDKMLQNLLFSKQKNNQPNEVQENCSQCFIKTQQMNKIKEQLALCMQEKNQLKSQLHQQKEKGKQIIKGKQELQNSIVQRQQNIIHQLDTKIVASTYQNILLEQAKGIQEILKIKTNLNPIKNGKENCLQSIQSYSRKQNKSVYGTNTNAERVVISEFTTGNVDTQGQRNSKFPYFNKNDQSHKASRNHTEVESTEKKKKQMQKKDSKQNGNTKDTGEQQIISNKSKLKNTTGLNSRTLAQTSNKRSLSNGLQPTKNSQIIERQYVTEFLISQPNGKTEQETKKQTNIEIKQLSQINDINDDENANASEYNPCDYQYIPFRQNSYKKINLNDEENYKNYMKYHLRNNIIQTLNKKGRNHSTQKIVFGNKYQNLINSVTGKSLANNSSRSISNSHRPRSSSVRHNNESKTKRFINASTNNNVPKTITYRKLLQMTKKGNTQKSSIS